MTAYRYAVIGCKLKQNANEGCNSCASLSGLVLCFTAYFILIVIAPSDSNINWLYCIGQVSLAGVQAFWMALREYALKSVQTTLTARVTWSAVSTAADTRAIQQVQRNRTITYMLTTTVVVTSERITDVTSATRDLGICRNLQSFRGWVGVSCVFINLKSAPGVYFRCTFSEVLKF